jgi:hypothetical protein
MKADLANGGPPGRPRHGILEGPRDAISNDILGAIIVSMKSRRPAR